MNLIKRITTVLFLLLITNSALAQQAPSFTLMNASGDNVSLSDYQGKPLILHFWATWCPFCKKLQPGLEALQNKYQAEGVELLAISFREDEGTMPQAVLNKRGHQFMTLINGEQVAEQYGVRGTPTTLFIDGKGKIVFKTKTSNPQDPKLELAVKKLIASN